MTVTVHDYALLRMTETDFDKKATATEFSPQDSGRKGAFNDHLAVRDAPLEPGHFPIVIYAPSFSNVSWETPTFANTWPVTATSCWRVPIWVPRVAE